MAGEGVMAKELTTRDDMDLGIDMSDMMMIMMMIMMMSLLSGITSTVATSAQSAQLLQAASYIGRTDARELRATNKLQWIDLIHDHPYVPWSWATFENAGPNEVHIGVNAPAENFDILPGGTMNVDRKVALEKMNVIFFHCDPGETATITVRGEY